jgi:pimeloyl-ACP methyl ester carboxylesterase
VTFPSSEGLPEPDRAAFADLGRTRIRLWQWGDPADPPVLLLHGGWDHGRMWDGIAPRLAALGYHVNAWDARGHGDSGRLHSSGAYWSMFVLDAALVARRLGAPVRVIGHSFGGGVTMSFLSTFPELVERAVNIDGLGPPPELFLVQDHAAVASHWLADAERIWRDGPREYATVEEMAQKRKDINTRLPIEWCRHLATHGTRPGPGGGWVWKADPHFRLGNPEPFSEDALLVQYRLVSAPVLVVTGREPDQWNDLPVASRDRRLGALRDVEHLEVDGAGHYVHIEQPDVVLDAVGRFFA